MTPRESAAIVALLCVLASDLSAQGEHAFDLDVPAARSSFWVIESVGSANRLDADLEIRELRRDSQVRPTFNIMLRAADREIIISMVQEAGQRDTTVSVILMQQGKMIGQQSIDGWRIEKGQRFQLNMDWSTPGVLAIAGTGTDRGKFKLAFVPTSLRISVSTGELLGHKIALTTR